MDGVCYTLKKWKKLALKSSALSPFILPILKAYYKGQKMLETIAIILIILWIFGLVSSYTMGGLIHILLVVAIVMVLIRLIQGRRL